MNQNRPRCRKLLEIKSNSEGVAKFAACAGRRRGGDRCASPWLQQVLGLQVVPSAEGERDKDREKRRFKLREPGSEKQG